MNGGYAFQMMPDNEVVCKPYGSKGIIGETEGLRYLLDCPICKYGTAHEDLYCDDCGFLLWDEKANGDQIIKHISGRCFRVKKDCDGKIIRKIELYGY